MSNVIFDETILTGSKYPSPDSDGLDYEAIRISIITNDDGDLDPLSPFIQFGGCPDGDEGDFEEWFTWGITTAEAFHQVLGEAIEKAKNEVAKFLENS